MLPCGSGFAVRRRSTAQALRWRRRPTEPLAIQRPMLETFQLGFRNLQEVWGLVLPPVTLLELKRLARPGGGALPPARRALGSHHL